MPASARVPLLLATVVAAGFALPTTGADAAIVCRDGFQLVQGNLLATPYCQDALVAAVARERGFKVSAHEIRWNPNLKRHVCQFIGRDIRVSVACTDANSIGRGPRG